MLGLKEQVIKEMILECVKPLLDLQKKFEKQGNRVDEITEDTSAEKYPSVSAVINFVKAKNEALSEAFGKAYLKITDFDSYKINASNTYATKTSVDEALGNKVDKVSGKGLSTNDYTTTEKEKLAGIEQGANKTVVDSALNSTSTNPVQNKVVNTALGNKVDKVSGKGLSTNDYTTTEKEKLAGIEQGANAYTHPTTSGNKHVPSGGSYGDVLRWDGDGTATWGNDKTPIIDTRSTNQPPEWYFTNYPKQVVREFKYTSAIGLSGEIYCCLETMVPWSDSSGGYPRQIATSNGCQWIRVGISNTTWSAWGFVFNSQCDVGISAGKAFDLHSSSNRQVRAIDITDGGNLRFGAGMHSSTQVSGCADGITEIVGSKINLWAKQSTEGLQPYYAAGDSFIINNLVNGIINEDGYAFEIPITLPKAIIGNPTIAVTMGYGVIVKQNGKYLYGCMKDIWSKAISTITVNRFDDITLNLKVTMTNATNVTTNCECAVAYHLYVTFS